MKQFYLEMVLCGTILLVSGCAGVANKSEPQTLVYHRMLRADGYGRFDTARETSVKQNWLQAQQSAKLDAYRQLAKLMYGQTLPDRQSVADKIVAHEAYRVYADTYLRSAQAVSYRTVNDNLQATLQLELNLRFFQCMGGDAERIAQCIAEQGKLPYTRLGYKTAPTTTADLACTTTDCSDKLYVAGFNDEKNIVDKTLLDAGLYDTEWTINTGARALVNYFFVNGLLNAL